MKSLNHLLTILIILLITSCIDKSEPLTLSNNLSQTKFVGKKGYMQFKNGFSDGSLENDITAISPWEIQYTAKDGKKSLSVSDASRFRHWRPNDTTLILEWDRFRIPEAVNAAVTIIVSMERTRPFTYWRISLDSIAGLQIDNLNFPRISLCKSINSESLAVPEWMGQILQNPRSFLAGTKSRKFEWSYPGPLSMQCVALYSDKVGFYASCDDTLAYRKNFSFQLDSAENMIFQISNFPPSDTSFSKYEPQYGFITGNFKGDWITAAEIYREWGSSQSWSKQSRFFTGKTPEWLEKNALWVWNRGKSSNVLVPASDLQKRIDLPVSVYWHWWHGCSYDDGFPEYVPPREGRNSFINAVAKAHNSGIRSIVYMNQALWGTTTESWKKEDAEEFAAKDKEGKILSHVFNIFSGKSTAYMCLGTQFWKDKYSTLCDSVLNNYKVDGVYMDMACLNTMCFDRNHGHPVGGGNYHLKNFGKMTGLIRSKIKDNEDIVLAGEGAGEVWMPYLDLFLTLAVSKERYAGPGAWETIPFFQAVYHQYAITYGNYSSLLVPPYDELWPKQFAPKEPLKMLDRKYSSQFMMEQARSFVWGLQPTISNYQPFLASERKEETDYVIRLAKVRNECLKYLLRGRFMRTPGFSIDEKEIDISRLSIYAGKTGESVTSFRGTYPLIYTGTWLSDEKTLGIALASISEKSYDINLNFRASDYDIPPTGSVYVTGETGKTKLSEYSDNMINVNYTLKPHDICVLEFLSN